MRSVELNNVQFLSVVLQKAEFRQTLLAIQNTMNSMVTRIPVSVVDG